MKAGSFLLFAFLMFAGFAVGQTTDTLNPFDLAPRLSSPATASTSVQTPQSFQSSDNPFDLSAPTQAGRKKSQSKAFTKSAAPRPKPSAAQYPGFLLGAILVSLLLLTFFITFFRGVYGRAYQATLNDNLLNQAYRDRQSGAVQAFVILYSMFFINAGLFLFLLLKHENVELPGSTHLVNLLLCIAGVTALFLLKHLVLWIVGAIFPITKEISAYSFTIMVFGIMLGLFLGPVNFLIAYAPEAWTDYLIKGTLAIMVLTYLLRSLRGAFIANNYLLYYKFHFLLYLCTVEIAPTLALVKIIGNHLAV